MRIRFSFKVMEYYGRYRKSRKAVELQIEEDSMVGIGRIEPFIAE